MSLAFLHGSLWPTWPLWAANDWEKPLKMDKSFPGHPGLWWHGKVVGILSVYHRIGHSRLYPGQHDLVVDLWSCFLHDFPLTGLFIACIGTLKTFLVLMPIFIPQILCKPTWITSPILRPVLMLPIDTSYYILMYGVSSAIHGARDIRNEPKWRLEPLVTGTN